MKSSIAVMAIVMQAVGLAGAAWAAPYTRIVSPAPGQCVPGPDVTIKFEAGGLTLGPSAWNLHFKLDDDPFQVQYDGNHAHVFKNVAPGTHTVRLYAANAMHEAIAGTQSVVTFSVGYGDGANAPVPGAPLLTHNLPQGEYLGIDAADITVDFLLENATVAPGGYQVAYYIDGRRFLVQDHCGPRHIKNLAPGNHRFRMELQDANGDLVPGAFNSTEKIILVSPDRVTKSPGAISDGYTGLPRIDSIKGSMTMGQHWSATEPVKPLTQEDVKKQQALTVHSGDRTVTLAGDIIPDSGVPVAEIEKEIGTAGHSAGAYRMTAQPDASDFGIREVEDLDTLEVIKAPVGDLDSAAPITEEERVIEPTVDHTYTVRKTTERVATDADHSVSPDLTGTTTITTDESANGTNVRRGSILVNSADEKEAIKDPDEAGTMNQETTARETRTTSTRRTRADGSTSELKSTGTLKLSDRPTTRTAQDKTTTTLHMKDAETTPSKTTVKKEIETTATAPKPTLD